MPQDKATIPMYTQQELDQKLLAAANCLRGPVDPVDFKAYIFPLLFFKRISDNYHYEHAKALEEFDGDKKLADLADNYRFVVPKGCCWEDLQAADENVGAALQKMLDRIQEANPETLAGIFGSANWADKEALPEHALEGVINVFDSLKLDPDSVSHDLLGNAYEYLLKNFADETGKKAGEFFTPRSVVRLMAMILGPKEGESICDPACGSGGLLVESVNEVRESGGDARTLRIYGQEVQKTTAAIARMNLYLHDIETFHIARGDTLREPKLKTADGELQTFDMIVANPPFSIDSWPRDAWADDPYGRSEFGVPPQEYADFAFVQHMITTMDPKKGRLAVVMPHGVLFRGGDDAKVREALVQSGLLDAVIGLPKNLFYSTSIDACILIFRSKALPKRKAHVLFIGGSDRFQKGKNQNELNDGDVQAFIDAYRKGTDPDGEGGVKVRLVPAKEIEENKYDLSIGRYIAGEAAEEIDVQEALADCDAARSRVAEAEKELAKRLKAAGIRA